MKTLLIVVIFTTIFVVALLYKVWGPPVQHTVNENRVAKTGVIARARVISMMDAGRRQERHPELRLELEIFPESGQSFRIKTTTFVSVYQLGQLIPGSDISVKYDPDQPLSVVILK